MDFQVVGYPSCYIPHSLLALCLIEKLAFPYYVCVSCLFFFFVLVTRYNFTGTASFLGQTFSSGWFCYYFLGQHNFDHFYQIILQYYIVKMLSDKTISSWSYLKTKSNHKIGGKSLNSDKNL